MSTKNPYLGAVLGFFVIGLFYGGGLKKGGIAFIVLSTISYVLTISISPTVAVICNLVGAVLGYTWSKQHNEQISTQNEQVSK